MGLILQTSEGGRDLAPGAWGQPLKEVQLAVQPGQCQPARSALLPRLPPSRLSPAAPDQPGRMQDRKHDPGGCAGASPAGAGPMTAPESVVS